MSSQTTLASVVNALTALRLEVRQLSSQMRFAEDRISRLEAATFTPPPSPSSEGSSGVYLPTLSPLHVHEPSGTGTVAASSSKVTAEDSRDTSQAKRTETKRKATLVSIELLGEREPCDIQSHLQPIAESIQALRLQMDRIEHQLHTKDKDARIPPAHSNPFAPLAAGKLDKPNSVRETARQTKMSMDSDPYMLGSRPIFGQPSNPFRKTPSRLNVAKSPFAKYAGSTSPFERLQNPSKRLVSFEAPSRKSLPSFGSKTSWA